MSRVIHKEIQGKIWHTWSRTEIWLQHLSILFFHTLFVFIFQNVRLTRYISFKREKTQECVSLWSAKLRARHAKLSESVPSASLSLSSVSTNSSFLCAKNIACAQSQMYSQCELHETIQQLMGNKTAELISRRSRVLTLDSERNSAVLKLFKGREICQKCSEV